MSCIRLSVLDNEIAERTRKIYTSVKQVSMTSSVKGSGNRPPQTLKEKFTGAKNHD